MERACGPRRLGTSRSSVVVNIDWRHFRVQRDQRGALPPEPLLPPEPSNRNKNKAEEPKKRRFFFLSEDPCSHFLFISLFRLFI